MDDANFFANSGFPVIRLHGIKSKGGCTCVKGRKCHSPGKHPWGKSWGNECLSDPGEMKHLLDNGQQSSLVTHQLLTASIRNGTHHSHPALGYPLERSTESLNHRLCTDEHGNQNPSTASPLPLSRPCLYSFVVPFPE